MSEDEFHPRSAFQTPIDANILPYAQAQGALERLDDRLRTSPVRRAWTSRMAIAERQALAWVDSFDLPEDALRVDGRGKVQTGVYDLTHWKSAIGTPVSLRIILQDPALLLEWLGGRDPSISTSATSVAARDHWEIVSAIDSWARACRALPPSPPLIEAGRLAALWRQHAPLGRGDTVASLLIGDRWSAGRWSGSQGGLVALGLRLGGGPWKIATGEAGDRLWLNALAAGARTHLELENRLRLYAARARNVLDSRRRPGRLKPLLLLAMERPAITSAEVSRLLKLTSAGAIKLLLTAQQEGLLVERTGQASYRSYAIPLSGAFSFASTAPETLPDLFEAEFWSEELEITTASEAH